jgi:hypothetical protein
MGERNKEWGTVLEREGHGSVLKIGETGLTDLTGFGERRFCIPVRPKFTNSQLKPV